MKALSRRLANGWGDEYDTLTPVADLLARLQEEASKWLDNPAGWEADTGDERQREMSLDRIRQSVFARLQQLTNRRIKEDQAATWRTAYGQSGPGSGARRARIINEIHDSAAPHMSAAMQEQARLFLSNLYSILQEAIDEAGGQCRLPTA